MATDVDDGLIDAGNSLKVGGRATAAPPSLVEGARTPLSLDLTGALRVAADLKAASAIVDVALSGTGGTPDTVGIVGSTGNRIIVNADGSINTTGAASSGGTVNDGVSAAIKATVFDYVNSNPIAVRSVDSNGDPASSGGTTQYAEDTAATAGEQVVMVGVVRKDARGTLVDLDGDRAELQVNASGDLRVDGSAVTQPVSAAALPLPAGAATSALQLANSHDVTVDNAAGAASVNVQDGGNSLTVDGTFFQATQPVSAASLPLPAGAATSALQLAAGHNVTIIPPTLTKGTQGATGLSVQNLKDAGRNQTNYFMVAPIQMTALEVMQSLTGYKGGIAVAATVSPAVVTAAKTFRITQIVVSAFASAAIGSIRVSLRANLSGLGVIGSPLVWNTQVGIEGVFTASAGEQAVFLFPDGLEFPAGTGIAIGALGFGAPTTAAANGFVKVEILGFEY